MTTAPDRPPAPSTVRPCKPPETSPPAVSRGALLLGGCLSALAIAGCDSREPTVDPGVFEARSLAFPEAILSAEECAGRPCVVQEERSIDGETATIFVVGDMGLDTDGGKQREVAQGVVRACAAREGGCTAGLFLGDNLYDAGLEDDDDEARFKRMIDRYPPVPKYFTLGNHDWRKIFPSRTRAWNELEYLAERDDTRGSAHFFHFRVGPVEAVAFDTNYLVRTKRGVDQVREHPIAQILPKSEAPWSIAFGHHPFLSTGAHGNAGHYRDAVGESGWRGKRFRRFLESDVLPHADLYLAGHEHSLQFYPPVERLVSSEGAIAPPPLAATAVVGSGAKSSGPGRPERCADGPVKSVFEYYGHGFAIVTAEPDSLAITMFNEDGEPLWSATKTRDEGWSAPAWEGSLCGRPDEVGTALGPEPAARMIKDALSPGPASPSPTSPAPPSTAAPSAPPR